MGNCCKTEFVCFPVRYLPQNSFVFFSVRPAYGTMKNVCKVTVSVLLGPTKSASFLVIASVECSLQSVSNLFMNHQCCPLWPYFSTGTSYVVINAGCCKQRSSDSSLEIVIFKSFRRFWSIVTL